MKEKKEDKFGTKAETLNAIEPFLKSAKIPKFIFFSVLDWKNNKGSIISEIKQKFINCKLAIRSSSNMEDGAVSSMAGYFDSLLDIDSNNLQIILTSIENVISSMKYSLTDQVIVQEMASKLSLSGVIMSFEVTKKAPYYCIEYDDESGKSDSVTSGKGKFKSVSIFRLGNINLIKSKRILAILKLAKEIEEIVNYPAIDIEFGLDQKNKPILFQVRRIVGFQNNDLKMQSKVSTHLDAIENSIKKKFEDYGDLLGDRSIFAVMPDWNPAEIIGYNPKKLSTSLYSYLITNGVWQEARELMGYRKFARKDLMVLFDHHPFIDVRISFNSFLPDKLSDSIATKLVDSWLKRFEENPEYHDKVEFEIVPTCLDFKFDENFKTLYSDVLLNNELEEYRFLLKNITEKSLDLTSKGTLIKAIKDAEMLLEYSKDIRDYEISLKQVKVLIDLCKKLGTLNFAIAARHAFISEAILRSAVEINILDINKLNKFKQSIQTISSSMIKEFTKVCKKEIDPSSFLKSFGHLRPGTYDINSYRYDERADIFENIESVPSIIDADYEFNLSKDEKSTFDKHIHELFSHEFCAEDIFKHARLAIASRERLKFIFTKYLSDALKIITEWGENNEFSRDDLAYIGIESLMNFGNRKNKDLMITKIRSEINENKKNYNFSEKIKLPYIITRPSDIYIATTNRITPNFIGRKKIIASVIQIGPNSSSILDLKNKIICIENADPGFDWIFTKSIGALLTRFGGANSHMAVRCAELGIPATIGCGDQVYERIIKSTKAEMNCSERIIRPIHG